MTGKRILVPVDLEKKSFDNVAFVAGLGIEMPVSVTLLYVVNLNVSALERRVYDELRKVSEQRLRALASLFFSNGSSSICVRVGRPHEQILAEAEQGQAELIVVASKTSSRRRWQFFPTTVERVVREAPCLTLVLPCSWRITPEQYRQATYTVPDIGHQADQSFSVH